MFPVIWHGRYFTTLCPFHDDNSPSFLVYANGGVCLAASCQRKASLIEVFNRITHQSASPNTITLDSSRLVDWESIPDREQLCADAHQYMLANPGMDNYLRQRNMQDAVRPCQLGWWHGFITIPIFSDSGHAFLGCAFRATPALQATTGARYITPPNQPRLLYRPHGLANRRLVDTTDVYIVFGIFDAIALTLIGLRAITSTNITGFRPIDLQDYRCKLIVVPDRGEEAKGRQLVSGLDWRGELKLLSYPDGMKDPADFIQAGQRENLHYLLTF